MNIDKLYDPEFRKSIKSKKPTIIIPVGSIEQHGAHLPISTDSDIVTEIASRLAKKCGFIVFPTISYGVSQEHDPFFNMSLESNTLRNIIGDIDRSVVKNKLKSVIILNGHHGNILSLKLAERKTILQRRTRIRKIRFYSYWHFMKHKFDHAGFVETSIMLAISDKVKMKNAKK